MSLNDECVFKLKLNKMNSLSTSRLNTDSLSSYFKLIEFTDLLCKYNSVGSIMQSPRSNPLFTFKIKCVSFNH